MDAEATVRAYYAALDDARYDDLRDLLAPGFAQRRPDREFPDRESFVAFVRDDRPHDDTTHDLDGVYARTDAADATGRPDDPDRRPDGTSVPSTDAETVLARGVVRKTDDDAVVVRFVDCFDVLADRIVALDTYTR